jgi:hypothetical protein
VPTGRLYSTGEELQTKKPRGRPRKISNDAPVSTQAPPVATITVSETEQDAPARRGRKAVAKAESVPVQDEQKDRKPSPTRGRPPKSTSKQTEDAPNADAVAASIVTSAQKAEAMRKSKSKSESSISTPINPKLEALTSHLKALWEDGCRDENALRVFQIAIEDGVIPDEGIYNMFDSVSPHYLTAMANFRNSVALDYFIRLFAKFRSTTHVESLIRGLEARYPTQMSAPRVVFAKLIGLAARDFSAAVEAYQTLKEKAGKKLPVYAFTEAAAAMVRFTPKSPKS